MKGRAVWQSKLFRPCNVLFCAVFVKYFGKCFNVYFGKCFNVYLGKYFKVLYYLGESQGGGSCNELTTVTISKAGDTISPGWHPAGAAIIHGNTITNTYSNTNANTIC